MVSAPPLTRITTREAVDRYLRTVQRAVIGHTLARTTANNYERDLSEFVELAETQRGHGVILDDLTADDIDDIIIEYGSKPDGRHRPKPGKTIKTRGPGAQARFRQSVARLFSEAVLEGWVEANPMPRTRVRPRTSGLKDAARKALPESSAAALLDTPYAPHDNGTRARRGDMHLALRDEFLLRLLMEAGPRVSEVSNADRADLSTDDNGDHWLTVTGKGNKTRRIPLSPGTKAVYDAYIDEERPQPRPRTTKDTNTGEPVITVPVEDAEAALLLTWRGLRIKPRDIQYMVERACKNLPADVRRRVTPHGLRHTAATLLLASGAADIKTVKEILGHANIATTGIYLDTIDGEAARAVRMHPVTGDRRRRPPTSLEPAQRTN